MTRRFLTIDHHSESNQSIYRRACSGEREVDEMNECEVHCYG